MENNNENQNMVPHASEPDTMGVDQPREDATIGNDMGNDFPPAENTQPAGSYQPADAYQPTEGQQPVGAYQPTAHAQPLWEPPMQWQAQPQAQTQPLYAPPAILEQPRRAQRKRPGWVALVAASVAAALAGAGIALGGSALLNPAGMRPASMPEPQANAGTTKIVDSSVGAPDWEKVAEEVGATVVSLDVSTDSGQAQGSGVIIDEKGHILTNNHVVAGANELYVMFSDGRVFDARIMGTDEATDLAVVELVDPPSDLTVAQLGDSSVLNVGQAVAAIGNPMGLDSTLTTGVISALDRPTQADRGANVVTNAIQIDAAINPGNSGGPVFDQQGKVIGIASSIITVKTSFSGQGGGSIGLGFAIPVNLAKNISSQLIENGSAEHAYLGVTISNGLAKFDDSQRMAAQVKTVEPGTPAAKAGINEGDNIIEVNGHKVSTATALTGFIRQYRAGDVVNLKLERGGQLMEVDVTLATRPDPR